MSHQLTRQGASIEISIRATHIKTSLDAAAINVIRSKKDWLEEEE